MYLSKRNMRSSILQASLKILKEIKPEAPLLARLRANLPSKRKRGLFLASLHTCWQLVEPLNDLTMSFNPRKLFLRGLQGPAWALRSARRSPEPTPPPPHNRLHVSWQAFCDVFAFGRGRNGGGHHVFASKTRSSKAILPFLRSPGLLLHLATDARVDGTTFLLIDGIGHAVLHSLSRQGPVHPIALIASICLQHTFQYG